MPNATDITVREVVAKFDADFTDVCGAFENGEYALWVGSGISRQAPNLGKLIERAIEYLRQRAVDPTTSVAFMPALNEAIKIGGADPAAIEHRFAEPFETWPERTAIINGAWNEYSQVLDIRVHGERSDFILWDAIDIRDAFANPAEPAAEHLCIAILILEAAVQNVASANWDGFIEAAVNRLGNGVPGLLQVVVDPNQMRDAPGRAKLLKFHGCVRHATDEPQVFREYLTGSSTQIEEWPEAQKFSAMCSAVVSLATSQKTMVLGLSIQDTNLRTVFARAKQSNPWPWPCAPSAAGHVFCENEITQGQRSVLRLVYGEAYNDHFTEIHTASHLRAWGEQVLIALVLKLLADKLIAFMSLHLTSAGRDVLTAPLMASLVALRNGIADLAVADSVDHNRTKVVEKGVAQWSRLLSIFRTGALPTASEAYEALSSSTPNLIVGDANAQASGLGGLAVGLALLQNGVANDRWALNSPAGPEAVAGALSAKGTHEGATERPVFLVSSATQAIKLQREGAFANDNAVVVHGDDTWHFTSGRRGSARRVRSAIGRAGHVETTHISLERLINSSESADALQQAFVNEMVL